jgi:peptidoglycan/LPS O-acetylase OafA/YrhL
LLEALALASMIFVAPNWIKLYTLPTLWALAMVVGAMLQVAVHRYRFQWPQTRALRIGLIVASTGFLGAISFYPNLKELPWTYALGALKIGLATAVLIMELKRVGSIARWARPLLWLGTVSYAAYLWNYPISVWLHRWESPFAGLVSIPLTLVAASLSWFAIEKPILEWKKRLEAGSDPDSGKDKLAELG